jgi:hypothetical protein
MLPSGVAAMVPSRVLSWLRLRRAGDNGKEAAHGYGRTWPQTQPLVPIRGHPQGKAKGAVTTHEMVFPDGVTNLHELGGPCEATACRRDSATRPAPGNWKRSSAIHDVGMPVPATKGWWDR